MISVNNSNKIPSTIDEILMEAAKKPAPRMQVTMAQGMNAVKPSTDRQAYEGTPFYRKVQALMKSDGITEGAAIARIAAESPELHERAVLRTNGEGGPMSDAEILARFKGQAEPLDRMAGHIRKGSPGISEAESYRQATYYIANTEAKK
jgi:hypothetical protein